MIFSLALMEMEIPRHCEARSNLVDCNGQQELQLLKMLEQFASKRINIPIVGFYSTLPALQFLRQE
jgi:hypothetical protein